MIYLAAAIVLVALLAWDGWRRYLADRKAAHDRAQERITDHADKINALARDLNSLRGRIDALDERLRTECVRIDTRAQQAEMDIRQTWAKVRESAAVPVDVSEFRAELDTQRAAMKQIFEDVRDGYVRKDELKKLEESLRAGQSAIVATGNVSNGRMRMPLR